MEPLSLDDVPLNLRAENLASNQMEVNDVEIIEINSQLQEITQNVPVTENVMDQRVLNQADVRTNQIFQNPFESANNNQETTENEGENNEDDHNSEGEQDEEEDEEVRVLARKRPRIDSEDEENNLKEPEAKKTEEKDDESSCQICMEPWTSSGFHRLCCLACGHLFGQECILRWLKGNTPSARRCPTCNKKADLKDVRVLYTTKLSAVDNYEIDRLKNENEALNSKNKMLEIELSTAELRNRVFHEEVQGLRRTIKELEYQIKENATTISEKYNETLMQNPITNGRKFHMEKSIEIDPSNGCRVFDINNASGNLAISQKTNSRFSMFAGYGIKLIDVNLMSSVTFIPVHQDAIRDLSFHSFHQSLILSVGYDKTAKLVDVNTRSVVHNFPVGLKAWSCCWAGDNPNGFLVGCEQGKVVHYDIRQTTGAVDTLQTAGLWSPVASLASVSPNSSPGIPRGGFLSCHLNCCYAYELRNGIYTQKPMFLDGSFFCVRYDEKSAHGLISSRGKTTSVTSADHQSKHSVFSIERGDNDTILCQTVHTFEAGDKQAHITRPCFVDVGDDTLVAAHQESTNCIPLRSFSTGKLVYSIPVSDPVVDICSFKANNNICLATLSSSHLRLYHYLNIN